MNELMEPLTRYDWGGERASLYGIEIAIQEARGDAARLAGIEQGLIEVLQSGAPLPAHSGPCCGQRGRVLPASVVWRPLETLSYLCQEGRLRGTASMTRTAERCVSFSAVPLVPLLTRRTFRSHLGRWDWEPYGLLIRRDALQAIGARHVIYGDESDYACLHSHQQPFFQPQQRKGEQQHEWSEEREWRVLGDVDLRMLPNNSVIAFVRSQREARQFARYCNWPVLWLEE